MWFIASIPDNRPAGLHTNNLCNKSLPLEDNFGTTCKQLSGVLQGRLRYSDILEIVSDLDDKEEMVYNQAEMTCQARSLHSESQAI